MSLSGKGCEKCNGKGRVPFDDDAPGSMMRPCGACSEPWGPRWLDAPDGPGFWWMLVDGAAPEAVRVEVFDANIGPYAQVTTTRHTFGPPDVLAPTAKWLRITPPTEPTR